MGTFDLIHFVSVESVDCGAAGSSRLHALRERALHIARSTGQEPVSWYEFKHASLQADTRTMANMILGCGIGLALGIVLGLAFAPLLFPLALSCALIGGTVGAFSDTENARRNRLMTQYDEYLSGFEARMAPGAPVTNS
jgi:hypothetical protein